MTTNRMMESKTAPPTEIKMTKSKCPPFVAKEGRNASAWEEGEDEERREGRRE
jgi:hypothetical protein